VAYEDGGIVIQPVTRRHLQNKISHACLYVCDVIGAYTVGVIVFKFDMGDLH
jgi:hypothetical protein